MFPVQNTWTPKHFNLVKFNGTHTDILVQGLGPSLFTQKTATGTVELPAELGNKVFEYLSVLDIHLLKRVNKKFRPCINDFTRFVFRERTCFDLSTVSDTQLISYFLQDRINPLILKAFGRALVEGPFLGRFQNTHSIPSHERYAIARGLVATDSRNEEGERVAEPFISFYIGRRDQRPFTALTERTHDNQRWRVQLSIPAVRFIYVRGMYGHELYSITQDETHRYLPDNHPDRDVARLGELDSGFGMRFSIWRVENLVLISQIFENLDRCYMPFTSEIPIAETISSQEPIGPVEEPQIAIEPLEEEEQPLAENFVEPQAFLPPQGRIDEAVIEEVAEPNQNPELLSLPEQENHDQAVEHGQIIPQPLVPHNIPLQSSEPSVVLENQNLNGDLREAAVDEDVQPLAIVDQQEEPQIPVVPNIQQRQPTTAPAWYVAGPLFIWQNIVLFWSWLTGRSR